MVESKKYLTFAPSKTSGSSSVGRASAFQAECREFEPRLPLDHMNKFKIVISGSSSVGRASAFQAECREFEPRLPLLKKILDTVSRIFYTNFTLISSFTNTKKDFSTLQPDCSIT